jgi:hypothetical protein
VSDELRLVAAKVIEQARSDGGVLLRPSTSTCDNGHPMAPHLSTMVTPVTHHIEVFVELLRPQLRQILAELEGDKGQTVAQAHACTAQLHGTRIRRTVRPRAQHATGAEARGETQHA